MSESLRTKEEIQAEIDKLQKGKEDGSIPPYSGFGDDNHGGVDAQVSYLEEICNQVQEKPYALEPEEDGEEEGDFEDEKWDAYEWLTKEDHDSPSKSWSIQ